MRGSCSGDFRATNMYFFHSVSLHSGSGSTLTLTWGSLLQGYFERIAGRSTRQEEECMVEQNQFDCQFFLPPSEKVTWESFNRLYPSYDWRWLWYIRYHEVSVCSHDTESSLSSHLPKIFQKEEEDSRKKTEELKMQSNMEWQECEDRQDWIKVPL